jgi:hypothetical protein
MIDVSTIVPALSILIFGLITFRDWDEIELDWQTKKFKIKRRQAEYLLPNNLDTLPDKSAPKQLLKE